MLFLRGVLLIPDRRRPCLPVSRAGFKTRSMVAALMASTPAAHLRLQLQVSMPLHSIHERRDRFLQSFSTDSIRRFPKNGQRGNGRLIIDPCSR